MAGQDWESGREQGPVSWHIQRSPTRPLPDAAPELAVVAGADAAPGGGEQGGASDNSDISEGHRGAHLLHGLQYAPAMKFEAGEGSAGGGGGNWMTAAAAAARPVAGVTSVHQLPVFALWND
ncbi:hypothetical protein EJB05_07843, partial [Eragrostis curvula]